MKALDHIRITAEAVRQFVRFSQNPVVPLLLQHSSLIQKGSEDADISPIYTRVTNWHFYNKNLDRDVLHEPIWSFMEPLTFHLSSDHILKKRCEELDQEIAKKSVKDACNLTGRILHHIQDMSTPSHVVPVYHGFTIRDSFETYLSDHYLSETQYLETISEKVQHEAADLRPEQPTTILQLYSDTAENTLEYLKPENSGCRVVKNGKETTLPWSYFWADRETIHLGGYPSECKFGGFGTFGPLGMHFGTKGKFDIGDDTYLIEQEVYNNLCQKLVQDMLKNSIKTLFLLESQLEKLI